MASEHGIILREGFASHGDKSLIFCFRMSSLNFNPSLKIDVLCVRIFDFYVAMRQGRDNRFKESIFLCYVAYVASVLVLNRGLTGVYSAN